MRRIGPRSHGPSAKRAINDGVAVGDLTTVAAYDRAKFSPLAENRHDEHGYHEEDEARRRE